MFVCDKNHSCCDHQYWDRWEDVEQDAKECGHLVEVEYVTHGKWVSRVALDTAVWECSGCKTMGSPQWKRCPVCEAKMDLEEQ